MPYPVERPEDWSSEGHLSTIEKLRVILRNRRHEKRAPKPDGVSLTIAKHATQAMGANDIILLCVVKNAEKYLPSFLHHYREMGIARFAFVDDRSDDATRPILEAAVDVDVHISNVGFREALGGLFWRDRLVDFYGRNRWYVSIDSDEYLIFPGCEDRPLAAFVADLERRRLKRALAVMIDIYPDGPLSRIPPHLPPESLPTTVCPLYDGDGYTIANERFCTSVRGGPRLRLFGTDMRVTKFPLLYADAATRFAGGSHHGPLPIQRNYSPVHAVLLHHKFPSGAVQDFQDIATRGSHAGGSTFYKAIVDHRDFHDDTDFRYAGSLRYSGSQDLVDRGFMQDLRRI